MSDLSLSNNAVKPTVCRVLIVKTSSMGDLVHTLSAVHEAAALRPEIAFDWVCEEAFVDIPRLSPAVDRVLPVAIRRWRRRWWSPRHWAEIRGFLCRLRERRYDVVIDAQGLMKTAWITASARSAPGQRWGYDRFSIRERLAGMGLKRRVAAPREWHAIERLRTLFAKALGFAPRSGMEALRFASQGGHTGEILFFHGTTRAEKSWPLAQWIALGQILIAAGFTIALPWGSRAEQAQAQAIADALGARAQVLPALSIGQLAERMRHASGAIGVDSGLMHLSVALGCPTVALMCAAYIPKFSAQRFAPYWSKRARVVSASSANSINAEQAMAAWRELAP